MMRVIFSGQALSGGGRWQSQRLASFARPGRWQSQRLASFARPGRWQSQRRQSRHRLWRSASFACRASFARPGRWQSHRSAGFAGIVHGTRDRSEKAVPAAPLPAGSRRRTAA